MGGSVSMIDGHIDEVLKPCPFCGGEAAVVYVEWCACYVVKCQDEYEDCDVLPETRYCCDESEAIEAWNRRAGNG